MSDFLAWMADPDNAEEMREVKRHLRCTDAEAVTILLLGELACRLDRLESEVAVLTLEDIADDLDDPDEDG